MDLDCSNFDKADFPSNYIEYIKENMDKADIIFVSSQQSVRNALVENKIHFTLYYPSKKGKKNFLKYTKIEVTQINLLNLLIIVLNVLLMI